MHCLVLETAADESVTPSDVYDIASLLLSELAYMQNRVDTKRLIEPYYPGYKTPSHVYQRAQHLQRYLAELERLTRSNPQALGLRSR